LNHLTVPVAIANFLCNPFLVLLGRQADAETVVRTLKPRGCTVTVQ
jgi:type III secretory pathway component EscT